MDENQIGHSVVDTAVNIHRETGPGLLESVYEIILTDQLQKRGFDVKRQVAIPITFRGLQFAEGFKADLVVDDKVIVELKCVEKLNYSHKKQLLTYLRLSGMHLGFLLKFNGALMKDGIHRIVNKL